MLGPLLFIIYINDLDSGIISDISKFADDTKIGKVINSVDDTKDLQEDLDRLSMWARKWQMEFNVDKCKTLSLGNGSKAEYYLNNKLIAKTECERDLGVLISRDLKPRQQCIEARNKANRMLGFIKRSVSNRTPTVILQLYLALVRPHLDYAVQFWSPHHQVDIDRLERVQKSMTKLIPVIRNRSYEERLAKLNLHSLKRRRARGDMIEVYKWFSGINKGDLNDVLRLACQDRTRNNGYKLDKFRFRRDVGKYWFSNRVADLWNRLPSSVVGAGTLNCFKSRLDKYMGSVGWV